MGVRWLLSATRDVQKLSSSFDGGRRAAGGDGGAGDESRLDIASQAGKVRFRKGVGGTWCGGKGTYVLVTGRGPLEATPCPGLYIYGVGRLMRKSLLS